MSKGLQEISGGRRQNYSLNEFEFAPRIGGEVNCVIPQNGRMSRQRPASAGGEISPNTVGLFLGRGMVKFLLVDGDVLVNFDYFGGDPDAPCAARA